MLWAGAGRGWTQFLVHVSLTASLTVVNIVARRKSQILPQINNFVGCVSMLLFLVFMMAFLLPVSFKHSSRD